MRAKMADIRKRFEAGKAVADKLTREGMTVRYNGETHTTRSLPWCLGHGDWVVSLVGKSGGQDCSMMEVLDSAEDETPERGAFRHLFKLLDAKAAKGIREGTLDGRTALALLHEFRELLRFRHEAFADQLIPTLTEKALQEVSQ